jgi:hypothetical protein
MRELDMIENAFDFVRTQDNRKFLFLLGPDELQGGPWSFQSQCVEILDAAKRYGRRDSGPFAVVLILEKIKKLFLVRNFLWRFLIMIGKLFYSSDIHIHRDLG